MTDLDLSKYEGHTEGDCGCRPIFSRFCDDPPDYDGMALCPLHKDAPLLLAEVKRLREDLKVQREMHAVCLEIHDESASCLEAEEKLEDLRQSHARLLAAIKFERNESGCWCDPPRKAGHTIGCSQLRAAVAEAEALNG